MALVADNLSRNATLYKDLVSEFSVRFQIEEPLIYAIMEQESAFNPQATSWVPAYGLMQLVPRSGGRDAYRFVYKVDRIPEVSYLYNPRNNIELGTAYLRVLMNQFERVTDPHCRRLCVIAGYNTGAGNVSRSFIGSTNLSKAFSSICQFDYEGLYNHLVKNLPHEETRNYVVKVTQRREKYIKK
jgi:soluble lytic murein transglycosylase-like protein